MADEEIEAPDSTAVRVALWRAMHLQVDAPPHVLEDEIGLRLAAPDDDWRARPDMDPAGTSGFRAAIVARARFIEDLVAEQAGNGTCRASPQTHSTAAPFSWAASRARDTATSEMSIAVTVQPR